MSWSWRGLLAVSVAVPLALLGIAAGQNYRTIEKAAEARALQTVDEMHEQALEAFAAYAVVLARTDDRIRGLDWQKIETSRRLHRFLADLATLPRVDAVSIADERGRLRASGRFFPAPQSSIAERDYFIVQKARNAGIFVGLPHIGRLDRAMQFDVSRRRTIEGGGFDGIVVVSARASHFSKFYSTLSREEGFTALLLRRDGRVIVRYPANPAAARFSPPAALLRAMAADPEKGLLRARSQIDGTSRIYGYERVAGYPVYVVFGIPVKGIEGAWRANLFSYLVFAAPAALALFLMTLFAGRQLLRQQIASWRWRSTARRLRREADRRAQTEAELRQAQKMEALGQLTGGVAHDFNNLLTVLQGNLEILGAQVTEAGLRAKIEQALKTVERGERLTEQLLAFARRQPLHIRSLDLNTELRGMAELLARTVGGKISLETEFPIELWPARADANQLELALINLAINARDAMPEGGSLRIRTFNQPQRAGRRPPTGDFAGIEVSDTGTGMPPEVRARAFEPFFTTKEPGRGTGLGLSMVYDFARRSGGTATIESEVGRGTRVTVLLPRGGLAAAPEEQTDEQTGLPEGGRS
ncbi:MAG TPA: ATP-binding protein [Stellaceae bacterium]|nr:ATP-binding protein [Stellaceae bacterium]